MTIQHQWRTVNGVNLHLATAGSGPLIILLHGFPEFWFSWRHQIPVLAEHYTVVAPDMRGYNKSDKPSRVADYEIQQLVEDVVQLVRSFGAERAIFVGHDWGGLVAWEVAFRYPQLVEKLIILNVPHPRLFLQHLITNPRQLRRSSYVFFFQLPYLPEALFKANDYAAIEQTFRRTPVHRERFSDEVIEQYKHAARRADGLSGGINYYRAAARRGLRKATQPNLVVEKPTLVIWGEQDVALGKELNNNLEHYVPLLTLHYIPDAGHWVQQERPDLVNQYMLSFLGHHR